MRCTLRITLDLPPTSVKACGRFHQTADSTVYTTRVFYIWPEAKHGIVPKAALRGGSFGNFFEWHAWLREAVDVDWALSQMLALDACYMFVRWG